MAESCHFALFKYMDRSPKVYEELKDSNMLILSSGRQLGRYKNKIPQGTGVNDDILKWMHSAAKDINLCPDGWSGGLIHDETAIQPDLVMSYSGGIPW